MTFEEMPSSLEKLLNEVAEIKQLLAKPQTPVVEFDKYLTTAEAAKYLNLSVHTVYGRVCKNTIPHIKKGNKLRFTERELKEWLRA